MVTLTFTTSEETLAAIQKIAEREQTTVEAILSRLAEEYAQEQTPLDVAPDEERSPFEDWDGFGMFKSGHTDTGRRADEILAEEEYAEEQSTSANADAASIDYPDWMKPGLFNSGYTEDGRRADEILAEEGEPDEDG